MPSHRQLRGEGPPLAGRLLRLPLVEVLGRRVPSATSRRSRLLGLAFLDSDRAGAGLLIPRCSSVHTFGMRFDLDIHFLDEAGGPVRVELAVPANRCFWCPGAKAVLELVSPGGENGRPRP